jgi:hypothetical protein
MTREEFEVRYAARSGISVEELRSTGRQAVPCDCGSDMCTGWAMESHHPDDRPGVTA